MNQLFLEYDREAFFFINQTLRNEAFDLLMPWLREKYFWIPLYALLVGYFIYRLRWRSVIVMIGAALTIILADQISSSIIKPLVARPRPCNDETFASQVHLLVGCGGGYSFVSSHAANHFGLAVFLIMLLKRRFRWITWAALLWAVSVAFAQVYVGVHYPADVICGGLLGLVIGMITGKICIMALKKSGAEVI